MSTTGCEPGGAYPRLRVWFESQQVRICQDLLRPVGLDVGAAGVAQRRGGLVAFADQVGEGAVRAVMVCAT